MATKKSEMRKKIGTDTKKLHSLQSLVDNATTAIMMIDRELVITYINKSSIDLMKKNEDVLQSLYPGFDANNILGTSIDNFHANPAHQRKLLADPNNLPISTDIRLGSLLFKIRVSAQTDKSGKYCGCSLEWFDVTEEAVKFSDYSGQINAISKSQAVIEFNMDGTIINANENFLSALDYSLEEIKGKHHSLFVESAYKSSAEYTEFWAKLNRGEYDSAEYKRIGKGGKEVWIQASYNPIMNLNGVPFKVVKYATDITQQKLQAANYSGQINAISKSQAVIEFNMDGTIINANENFLSVLGYSLEEVKGKHHSLFVESAYKSSVEYSEFWAKLNRGEYDSAEYKRIGKGGKEVWIQASYNPIMNLNGVPFKVVKYATDVTQQKLQAADYSGQINAIGKSQAVIEFNMDGTIINANENFLSVLGYSLEEVKGKHHSLFVESAYKSSVEYSEFWAKLNRGEYDSAEYKRIGRGGKEVWIQASYNPIMDLNGSPFKVVKYATDITDQKNINFTIENVLKETNHVMQSLSNGILTQKILGEYEGEFSKLSDAVNNSIHNLFNMVVKIRESSTNITSAASEIAQGNTDLSQRTEEQASSLEETASSMEEMTSTVRQNADNAKQADQLASAARGQAEKGGEVVGKAVIAMSEINTCSKKIADIIGVIDEIAFQTNLLALNAAVEAARAGEQGRGFAVVATEVRNLAQRSAAAAKEIKTLIQDSVEKVDEGSRLVDKSGTTLEEIVNAVKKVSDIIAEIAAASLEQSTGIDQVNKAITQMDEVTQQNAALVEEAAAASESMNEQAKGLSEMMEYFNVGDQEISQQTSAVHQSTVVHNKTKKLAPNASAVSSDDWDEF